MKKLLPLLLCYVLMSTQCYALSGGPVYGGGRSVDVIGAYSGVIQGVSQTDSSQGPIIPGDPDNGTGTGNGTVPSNALGLFDLVVPGVSTSTGAFVLFASGRVFGGIIAAWVDPDTAKLSGVLNGAYAFTVTTFDATGAAQATDVTATAVGQINATIRPTAISSFTSARLTGTASLEVSYGGVDPTTLAPITSQVDRPCGAGRAEPSAAARGAGCGPVAWSAVRASGWVMPRLRIASRRHSRPAAAGHRLACRSAFP